MVRGSRPPLWLLVVGVPLLVCVSAVRAATDTAAAPLPEPAAQAHAPDQQAAKPEQAAMPPQTTKSESPFPWKSAPATQSAAGDRASKSPSWAKGSEGLPWGRVVFGTLIVILLICGGVWLLKRLNAGMPLNKGRYMEVLETRPLGNKIQLFLVKVGSKVVLLACRGENVTALGEFSQDDFPAAEPPEGIGGRGGFKSLMQHVLRGQR